MHRVLSYTVTDVGSFSPGDRDQSTLAFTERTGSEVTLASESVQNHLLLKEAYK